ncbi:dTMP kinase [Candidatus Ishikawella capsulata]|uniref:Thymidylate kinase n=1 Tax=Candidatus Ishikawaella capsulata Mpkobe TaxID=476281 RepID=C5WD14_9ENTR|nr:dTMP kinase [Candidatus Ishikawaella capsulata]BAH83220.1 thymidylate kinase [Candidatus Ishikawaella capsulata Mpkobe]
MNKGKFIVVEGIEGAGKSTICNVIVDILSEKKIKSIITREPGGTPLAEQLRKLIKQGVEGDKLIPKAELLMIYAARIQLLDTVIQPTLAKGIWVVGDRHNLSSYVYQGAGRQIELNLIKTLSHQIIGDFKPDLTIYLDVTPEIGITRVCKRGSLDLIEQESLCFFKRVRELYLHIVANDNSMRLIDATQPLQQVITLLRITLINWLSGQII